MKKLPLLGTLLLFAVISCTTAQQTTYKQFKSNEEGIGPDEPYEESVDSSCAYFYFLWGKSAELEDRNDEALEAYEKALVCDPKADYVMNKLIMLHIKMGRKEQALALMENVIAEKPSDTDTQLLMANLHASMGKSDKAVDIYNSLLKENPGNVRVLLMLGSLHAREKEYGKAQKVFERLVEKDPESYLGYYFLGKLNKELLFYNKALSAYEKALNLNWSSSLALEIAMLYEKEEQYEKAIEMYKRLLKEDASEENVRRRLIALYLKKDDKEQALAELKELKGYAIDVEAVDFTIGRILLEQEQYDLAIEHFSQMLKEDNTLDLARYMLALTYFQKGDKKTAKEKLGNLSFDFKGYEEAVLLLVKILEEEGDYAGAEQELKKRIAKPETMKMSFYGALAAIYKKQEKIDMAKQIFQEALDTYPAETRLIYEYGMFLDSIGERNPAIEMMEKILIENPDDPYALNYLGYSWADNDENLEKALEYVKKAVKLRPEDGFIQDSLGWVYFKMGDYDRAVEELEKALSFESDDPTINEHIGDAYRKLHKYKEALEAYEKAFENYDEEDKKTSVKAKIDALKK